MECARRRRYPPQISAVDPWNDVDHRGDGHANPTIGLFYGQFYGSDAAFYLPYFTASYIVWTFISSTINEAATSLVAAGNLVKSSQVPIAYHVLRMLQRNVFILGHNAIVFVLMWLFVRWPVGPYAFCGLIGLALLYGFAVGVSMVVAVICVRYRDIPPLLQVVTQFFCVADHLAA